MIPFYQPHLPVKSITNRIHEQLSSGMIGPGQTCDVFARTLGAYHHTFPAVLTNSGTTALMAAIHATGIPPGSRIGVPAYGVPNVENAVRLMQCEPVPVEIGLDGCIHYPWLSRMLTSLRAVIYVDFSGRAPRELAQVARICASCHIPLIEDACCAIGNKRDDYAMRTGMTGDVGVFSFSPHKLISTGQGGALVSNNQEFLSRAFRFTVPMHGGGNFRMSDIQAGMGMEMFHQLHFYLQHRRKQMQAFVEQGIDILRPDTDNYILHNIVFVKDAMQASQDLEAMGIGAIRNYTMMPVNDPDQDYPISQFWHEHALYLPFGLGLTAEQITIIGELARDYLKANKI